MAFYGFEMVRGRLRFNRPFSWAFCVRDVIVRKEELKPGMGPSITSHKPMVSIAGLRAALTLTDAACLLHLTLGGFHGVDHLGHRFTGISVWIGDLLGNP
jgi:hypothetical protein